MHTRTLHTTSTGTGVKSRVETKLPLNVRPRSIGDDRRFEGRAELNGRLAHVLGAEKDGRIPVRVIGDEQDTLCEVRVRILNLVECQLDVYMQVLEDRGLLDIILSTLARWERSGRASGVSKLWREAVFLNPTHWQHRLSTVL